MLKDGYRFELFQFSLTPSSSETSETTILVDGYRLELFIVIIINITVITIDTP